VVETGARHRAAGVARHVVVADIVVVAGDSATGAAAASAETAWLDGAAATDGTDRSAECRVPQRHA
jgi:hypothetical protein